MKRRRFYNSDFLMEPMKRNYLFSYLFAIEFQLLTINILKKDEKTISIIPSIINSDRIS